MRVKHGVVIRKKQRALVKSISKNFKIKGVSSMDVTVSKPIDSIDKITLLIQDGMKKKGVTAEQLMKKAGVKPFEKKPNRNRY